MFRCFIVIASNNRLFTFWRADDSSNSSDQQLQTEDRQSSDAAAYFDSAASVDNDLIDMAQK